MKKILPWLAITAAVAAGLFLDDHLCPFRQFTGLPCPSCGMSRAFLALLGGEIQQAFFMHPLFPLVPLVLILFLVSHGYGTNFSAVYLGIIILFLLIYAVRMILWFPHYAPMDYHFGSLLGTILF